MAISPAQSTLVTFPSALGWMAMIGVGNLLQRLTFGHPRRDTAVSALGRGLVAQARPGQWNQPLRHRLQAYAEGNWDEFRDVQIDLERLTVFQRRVVHRCRQIPYGKTLSYGQLAAKAGYPGAARAVGNCMAVNRVPLIVPCHRVLPADGRPGAYSAPGGSKMKQRLLALEAAIRSASAPAKKVKPTR